MFKDLSCWEGIHILYACSGLISAIIFCFISLITTFVYFENRFLSGNIMAKVNGRSEMSNQINKVLCCLLFTFVGSEGN